MASVEIPYLLDHGSPLLLGIIIWKARTQTFRLSKLPWNLEIPSQGSFGTNDRNRTERGWGEWRAAWCTHQGVTGSWVGTAGSQSHTCFCSGCFGFPAELLFEAKTRASGSFQFISPHFTTRKKRFPLTLSALIRLRFDFATWPHGDQRCAQKKGHYDGPSLGALPAPYLRGECMDVRAGCSVPSDAGQQAGSQSGFHVGQVPCKVWSVEQGAVCQDTSHHPAPCFLCWERLAIQKQTNKKVGWNKECARWHIYPHVCEWCLWTVLLQISKMQKWIKTPHELFLYRLVREIGTYTNNYSTRTTDEHYVKPIKQSPEWRIYVLIQKEEQFKGALWRAYTLRSRTGHPLSRTCGPIPTSTPGEASEGAQ